jgi:hypothetical protein
MSGESRCLTPRSPFCPVSELCRCLTPPLNFNFKSGVRHRRASQPNCDSGAVSDTGAVLVFR